MINEVWAEEAGLDANPLTLDKFTELLYKAIPHRKVGAILPEVI